MRHWLWLTIALTGALAPTTVLAQDEDKGASDQSDKASKKDSKGADKKGAQSDEGGGAADADAKPQAEEDASAEESSMSDSETAELRAFDAGGGEIKPKPKGKKKGKPKPPPPKDEEVGGITPSLGVLVGWGFQPWFHLAAGLRAGLDIGDIYAGVAVVYAFGQTLEDKSRVAGFTFKESGNYVLFGGEVGYNIRLESLSARPFLGIGAALTPRESCDPGCRGETGTHVYLAPGAMVAYPIDPVFIGLDVRYNVVLGLSDGSGAMASATAGMQF